MDGSGNLYGTTDDGGANGDGTVFEIKAGEQHDHHARVVQRNQRCESLGGARSWTAAAISTAQRESGGANDDGTVFEVAAGSNTITTLASFNGTNGIESRWRG